MPPKNEINQNQKQRQSKQTRNQNDQYNHQVLQGKLQKSDISQIIPKQRTKQEKKEYELWNKHLLFIKASIEHSLIESYELLSKHLLFIKANIDHSLRESYVKKIQKQMNEEKQIEKIEVNRGQIQKIQYLQDVLKPFYDQRHQRLNQIELKQKLKQKCEQNTNLLIIKSQIMDCVLQFINRVSQLMDFPLKQQQLIARFKDLIQNLKETLKEFQDPLPIQKPPNGSNS